MNRKDIESEFHVLELPTISIWLVLIMSFATYWLYSIYWFYSRASIINELRGGAIDLRFIVALGIFSLASLVMDFIPIPALPEGILLTFFLANLALYFYVIFTLIGEIEGIIYDSGAPNFQVAPFLAFFFSPVYLQYKINSAIIHASGEVRGSVT
jgi:hypothetical protein